MNRFLIAITEVMIPKTFLGGLFATVFAFIVITVVAHIASFYDLITLGTVVNIMTFGFMYLVVDFIVFGFIGLYGMRWYRRRRGARL